MIQVNFQFMDKESMNISFSLTCNSTGGAASSVIWMRDGFLLDNTGPLVETNASYSSVLMISGRASGTYTCTIRGTSDQDLGSANYILQGIINLQCIYIANVDLFFLSSFCSPCGCPCHSVCFLWPSGGQLESSIGCCPCYYWIQDLLWQWAKSFCSFICHPHSAKLCGVKSDRVDIHPFWVNSATQWTDHNYDNCWYYLLKIGNS